jgi:hypothetical protein
MLRLYLTNLTVKIAVNLNYAHITKLFNYFVVQASQEEFLWFKTVCKLFNLFYGIPTKVTKVHLLHVLWLSVYLLTYNNSQIAEQILVKSDTGIKCH